MTAERILAAAAILVGGVGTILALLIAFGVDISPDQHTAIQSVLALILLIVGALVGKQEVVAYRAAKKAEAKRK